MKIFLIIIATIIVISALIIGYAYNQFTYQPDYFDDIEQLDMQRISEQASETETRVADQLQQNGFAKLDGEQVMQLGLKQLTRKTNIDLNSVVKKTRSTIVDGKFKTEAVINVKALSMQKVPTHAREYVDTFLKYLPDTMADEVYVSFEGTPVNDNGTLRFANDVIISVGDFKEKLSGINTNRDIKLDLDMLYKIGVSELVVRDSYIELKK